MISRLRNLSTEFPLIYFTKKIWPKKIIKFQVNKWIRELREFGNKDIVLVIVGNKCDLEGQRQVNREQAEAYAKEVGALHFQGSAKSGLGIQELFKSLSTRKF